MRTKLIRNLKPGDRLRINGEQAFRQTAVITVLAVKEISRGCVSGRRCWEVCADYPYWWGRTGIIGYSDSRIEVLSPDCDLAKAIAQEEQPCTP